MSNLLSIILVAFLGVVGNVAYFEYRLRKEHRKEITKEQLTKLLLPLYMILKTDELELLVWEKSDVDLYEYESDKPDRLIGPIKNILDENLYLADEELHTGALSFIKWAYGEDSGQRFQIVHDKPLEQDVIFDDFRKLVYKKYDERKNRYLN